MSGSSARRAARSAALSPASGLSPVRAMPANPPGDVRRKLGMERPATGATPRYVFVTGGTGCLGRPLIARLLAQGHTVRAVTRPASATRLPDGCVPVIGDPLDAATFATAVAPADTLVHLVGTPRPNPWKTRAFREVDLRSVRASIAAARTANIRPLVYVSVAQPAPIMRDYIAVRAAGEAAIRASGITATILRPWYVLGPGHQWPRLLLPLYALLGAIPATSAGAQRLALVTHAQLIAALAGAVEAPADGVRLMEVPCIRAGARNTGP